jgi:hypothetical protein
MIFLLIAFFCCERNPQKMEISKGFYLLKEIYHDIFIALKITKMNQYYFYYIPNFKINNFFHTYYYFLLGH